MSQILNTSPFSEAVTSLNNSQIDFILAMYVKDHPEEWKLNSNVDGLSDAEAQVKENEAWKKVLGNTAWNTAIYGTADRPVIPEVFRKNTKSKG